MTTARILFLLALLSFPALGAGPVTCVVDQPWNIQGLSDGLEISTNEYTFTGQPLTLGSFGIDNFFSTVMRFQVPITAFATQDWRIEGTATLEEQVVLIYDVDLVGRGQTTFAGPLVGSGDLTIDRDYQTVTLAGDNSSWLGLCTVLDGDLHLDSATGFAIVEHLEVQGSNTDLTTPGLFWERSHQFAPGADLPITGTAKAHLQAHDETVNDLFMTGGHLQLGGGNLMIPDSITADPSTGNCIIDGAPAFSPGPHIVNILSSGTGQYLTMDGFSGSDPTVSCSKGDWSNLHWKGESAFAGSLGISLGGLHVENPTGCTSAGVQLEISYECYLLIDTAHWDSGISVKSLDLPTQDELLLRSGRLRIDGGDFAFPGSSYSFGTVTTGDDYPSLEVAGGSETTVQYGCVIAGLAGSKATLIVDGDDGSAPSTFRNTGGGLIRINDDILVADDPSSLGELLIAGSGAKPSTVQTVGSGSNVQIGREGDGTAVLRDGGHLEVRFDLNVGAAAGSSGRIKMQRTAGAPAPVLSEGDDLTQGGTEAADGGAGWLTSDGGHIEVADLLHIRSEGSLNVDGGVLMAGRVLDDPSALFVSDATVMVGAFQQSTYLDNCDPSPGAPLGTTEVAGSLTLVGGSLLLDLGADGHDAVIVSGALDPGGADVVLHLLDGFVPVPGDSFTVITAGTLEASLGDVSVENALSGLQYAVHQTGNRLTLVVLAPVSGVTETLPDRFALHGNHPNPFNPPTTFTFAVPRPGFVKLELYDTSGHLVRRLLNEHLDAGEHARRWDGRDDRGRALASGVYLARLGGGAEAITRRITLIRQTNRRV